MGTWHPVLSNVNVKDDEGSDDEVIEVQSEDDGEVVAVVKGGRKAEKAEWAFTHFNAPRLSKRSDGTPIWRWDCKYCECVHVYAIEVHKSHVVL